nr:uncharacterized protein CI109_005460 [Kwoniella shandongensis]KAA5526182.1 hypothetical protein CI109_005460 [Kwoniella shandongensis]
MKSVTAGNSRLKIKLLSTGTREGFRSTSNNTSHTCANPVYEEHPIEGESRDLAAPIPKPSADCNEARP